MATANEDYLDAMLRHQIGLMRLSGSVRNDVFELLDSTEQDLAGQIKQRLKPGGITPANLKRLQRLQVVISGIRGGAWGGVSELWKKELDALAVAQPGFLSTALRTSLPLTIDFSTPSPALLRAIVTSRPFEGKTLHEWSRSVARADVARIMDQVRIGMTQGESNQAIARRVVGSRAAGGLNGVTETARRQAAKITRTAVNHISNQANREFFKENADIFKNEVYVATLDGRTTPVCRSLDGRRFPIGEGPIPPLHFQCRSLRVAVIDDEIAGERFVKPTTERGLLREFTKQKGIPGVSRRTDLPRGTKGTFNTFSRQRVKELIGKVPAKVNYQEWLGRQSVQFQDDVLGVTRGRLFRQGELSLTKFVNRAGDEIPLRDLARFQRQAFIDAGLDPDVF